MSFFGLVSGQAPEYQESPRSAAILSDTRYLSGDGTFGASYKQEDGVEFKEESDEFGNRKGSYSYIDPTGQRRTVTYTAGKDGFQVPIKKYNFIHFYYLKKFNFQYLI